MRNVRRFVVLSMVIQAACGGVGAAGDGRDAKADPMGGSHDVPVPDSDATGSSVSGDAVGDLCAGQLPVDPCISCSCDPTTGEIVCMPARSIGTACVPEDCCTVMAECVACAPGAAGCTEAAIRCEGVRFGCDDRNGCTADECECQGGTPACRYAPLADGSACDAQPGDCATADSCHAGHCVAGPPPDLDDENPCTLDTCVKNEVVHEPIAGSCDDGNECTTNDRCFIGQCEGTGLVECLVPACASGASCVPGQGCVPSWMPSGSVCETADPCVAQSVCNQAHQCEPVAFVDCDDGNPCTQDGCDPAVGTCVYEKVADKVVDPGDACSGTTTCRNGQLVIEAGLACEDDGNPCTLDICEPASGTCGVRLADGTEIPGGDPCDGIASCHDGMPVPGAPMDCGTPEDGCLDGQCVDGSCVFQEHPVGTPCASDGIACTVDACDGMGHCGHAQAPGTCRIGSTCVADGVAMDATGCVLCDPATDPLGWTFLDGSPCGAEDGNPCAESRCEGGTCKPVFVAAACDDDIPCTKTGCVKGECGVTGTTEGCFFDGKCVAEGEKAGEHGDASCRVCERFRDWKAYSLAPVGTSCDDLDPLTGGDACDAGGHCVGEPCGLRISDDGTYLLVLAAAFTTHDLTPLTALLDDDSLCAKWWAIGAPWNNVEIRVRDDDGDGLVEVPIPDLKTGLAPYSNCWKCENGVPARASLVQCGWGDYPIDKWMSFGPSSTDGRVCGGAYTGYDDSCTWTGSIAVSRDPVRGTYLSGALATAGGCDGCMPACDGKTCGPDACGGSCGSCGAGLSCTDSGVCGPDLAASAGCAASDCGAGACIELAGAAVCECPSGLHFDGATCVVLPPSSLPAPLIDPAQGEPGTFVTIRSPWIVAGGAVRLWLGGVAVPLIAGEDGAVQMMVPPVSPRSLETRIERPADGAISAPASLGVLASNTVPPFPGDVADVIETRLVELGLSLENAVSFLSSSGGILSAAERDYLRLRIALIDELAQDAVTDLRAIDPVAGASSLALLRASGVLDLLEQAQFGAAFLGSPSPLAPSQDHALGDFLRRMDTISMVLRNVASALWVVEMGTYVASVITLNPYGIIVGIKLQKVVTVLENAKRILDILPTDLASIELTLDGAFATTVQVQAGQSKVAGFRADFEAESAPWEAASDSLVDFIGGKAWDVLFTGVKGIANNAIKLMYQEIADKVSSLGWDFVKDQFPEAWRSAGRLRRDDVTIDISAYGTSVLYRVAADTLIPVALFDGLLKASRWFNGAPPVQGAVVLTPGGHASFDILTGAFTGVVPGSDALTLNAWRFRDRSWAGIDYSWVERWNRTGLSVDVSKACQCSSGDCCDGCAFLAAGSVCATQTLHSCSPTGSCGNDVFARQQKRTCSGKASDCPATWVDVAGSSVLIDDCATTERCSTASFTCVADASCGPTCTNDCALGDKGCNGTGQRWYCGEAGDGDPCLERVPQDCPSGSTCQSGTCASCLAHDHMECIFEDVVWFDCNGMANDIVKSCAPCACAAAACQCDGPAEVVVDSHEGAFSYWSPSTSMWSASDHADASADGWFNTGGINGNMRYTFNLATDGTGGRWKTAQVLEGMYDLFYHVPSPDPFDPLPTGTAINQWIRCGSVRYWVKDSDNTSGDGLAVDRPQTSAGWNLLGTFRYASISGEVKLTDKNAVGGSCAIAFDAVRWVRK